MKYTVTVTKSEGWFGRVRTQTTAVVEEESSYGAVLEPMNPQDEIQQVEKTLIGKVITDRLLYAVTASKNGTRQLTVFNGNTLSLSREQAKQLSRELCE
jgi:hypothetical protein